MTKEAWERNKSGVSSGSSAAYAHYILHRPIYHFRYRYQFLAVFGKRYLQIPWKSIMPGACKYSSNMVLADDQQLRRAWDAFEANEFRLKASADEIVTTNEADQRC